MPPTGEQYEISGGGYCAVVTEQGATLRALSHDGVDLIVPTAAD
ncbi:MAG: aldose epimerase, partial [Propionibacterium sp.]|nr:aldose epimerase [Propionibacterium sp.]